MKHFKATKHFFCLVALIFIKALHLYKLFFTLNLFYCMNYKIIFLCFFIYPISIFSQKGSTPTSEDIAISTALKELYPDDDIAITSNYQEISFEYHKKTGKVTVKNTYEDHYINLKSRIKMPIFVFYDDQSYLEYPIVKYRNKKTALYNFRDEPYSSNGLFHNDARIKWGTINFPLFGYRYSFSYTKKYKDVKYFVSTYLDDKYPAVKRKIVIHVPNWLELEIKELNFAGHTINKELSKDEKTQITTYTYTIKNVAASQKKEHSPGPTYTKPHLLFLAKSHHKKGTTEKLFGDTKDLYNWYHSLILKMNDDPSSIVDKTMTLIQDCKSDEEKLKKIFYWVQDNIRYIAFEDGIAGFKPDECQNVYKKKYGDCKGMANLTKQMLKIAGYDARLAWIGTKRIAYDYSLPTIAVDNHMICAVLHNDKYYFLDATESYNPLGAYAERIQNKQVLIEDGDNYILHKIPSDESLHNTETLNADLKIENETIVGAISRHYNGQSKTSFLNNINSLQTDQRDVVLESYITNGNKNLVVSNIHVTDINDRDKDLNLNYQINHNNTVSSFDNEMYIDIDYYKEYKNLSLKDREISYLFPYKILEKTLINLEIPEGYKIKELPENLVIDTKDFGISFIYKHTDTKIVYEKIIQFKSAEISKNELNTWRTFHKKLKNQYQKQIILIKG